MRSKKYSWFGLFFFIVVCFGVAWLGRAVTTTKIDAWYATLAKPDWTPPDWVFAPVWTLLYLMMAVAAWLVWRKADEAEPKWPFIPFGIQLGLNFFWSCLFFGFQSPGFAFGEILFLWVAIAVTMMAFWSRSKVAGLLLVPYLAWVTFATALNYTIWQLNV